MRDTGGWVVVSVCQCHSAEGEDGADGWEKKGRRREGRGRRKERQ